MNRAEHYCAGCAEGERRAEEDRVNDRSYIRYTMQEYRHMATMAHRNRGFRPSYENYAAYQLGLARGYRANLPTT